MRNFILCLMWVIVAQQIDHNEANKIKSNIKITRNISTDLFTAANFVTNSRSEKEVPDDPQEYFKKRQAEISSLKSAYPHKFNTTDTTMEKIVSNYRKLSNGVLLNEKISVAGRIHHIRKANQNLTFYYLKADTVYIQVLVGIEEKSSIVRRGDIIGCVGYPGKSRNGDLTIVAEEIEILAPCLRKLPTNLEGSNLPPFVNLIVNDQSKSKFYTRAKIIRYIRNFLDNMGFLEIETPILNKVPGGATAIPFKTHSNELNEDFFLRISPELYHKKVVVGGIERVYEIGRQFRNEKIDETHNPEFTSCEFYMTYADYNDLMEITETLLSGLVKAVHGSYKIKYHPYGPEGEEVEIDFTPPFARVPLLPTLEKELNVTLPPPEKLGTPEANAIFNRICKQYNVNCSHPKSTYKIMEKLVHDYIQEKCIQPTFIIDYPQITSPLAKYHRNFPGLTERFELYVMKKELCNAYTELNDPVFQQEQFAIQDKYREAGDKEIPPTDEEFVTALEYGLPPTAGWGLGVDRLVMMLTDSTSIKDVLLFPAMEVQSTN